MNKALFLILLLSSVAFAAPKKIIMLRNTRTPGAVTLNYLFWFYPPTPRAAQPPSVWTGASVAENNALAAGTVIEQPNQNTFVTEGAFIDEIKAALVAEYTARDNQFRLSISSNTFYGTYYDNTWNP